MGQLLLNPFGSERHLLWTPLSPEECEARLDARFVDDPQKKNGWPRGPIEQYPIWGEAWPHRLSIRKRVRWGQPCQTVASGRLERASGGTVIFLRLSHSLGEALVELGFILFPVVGAIGVVLQDGFAPFLTIQGALSALGFYALVLSVLGGLHVAGRWSARDEGDWLLRFLHETLEAKELPPETVVQRRSVVN